MLILHMFFLWEVFDVLFCVGGKYYLMVPIPFTGMDGTCEKNFQECIEIILIHPHFTCNAFVQNMATILNIYAVLKGNNMQIQSEI